MHMCVFYSIYRPSINYGICVLFVRPHPRNYRRVQNILMASLSFELSRQTASSIIVRIAVFNIHRYLSALLLLVVYWKKWKKKPNILQDWIAAQTNTV